LKVLFVAGRWAQAIEQSPTLAKLKKVADVEVTYVTGEDEVTAMVSDVDVIITGAPITAKIIKAAPKLKMIQTTSVGYDAIDVTAAQANGVIICNVAAANANSVAELCFGLILDVARRIAAHDRSMRKSGWDRVERDRQVQIWHRTLGIVGLGAIGSRMAQIGKNGFNLRILACDPYITGDRAEQFGGQLVDLPTLMKESDIVTVHTPLNDETRHMIGRNELQLLKPTAIFINASRGPVVEEQALIQILQEGRISGAGLDVFETEPLPENSPLRQLENVVMVPHIGSTPGALRHMLEVSIENVLRVAKGQPPLRIQTPATFYRSTKWK
jgi:phosphoglycerate dehydrogenase-like enzyme